jgi:hypothetical protein
MAFADSEDSATIAKKWQLIFLQAIGQIFSDLHPKHDVYVVCTGDGPLDDVNMEDFYSKKTVPTYVHYILYRL